MNSIVKKKPYPFWPSIPAILTRTNLDFFEYGFRNKLSTEYFLLYTFPLHYGILFLKDYINMKTEYGEPAGTSACRSAGLLFPQLFHDSEIGCMNQRPDVIICTG